MRNDPESPFIFVRIYNLAGRIAETIARENPKIATIERSKQKRETNQIYVDFLQNARGKSVVAPYLVRPKPGAAVSAPLDWEEVESKKISVRDFTIENMPERVKKKGDIFKSVLTNKQNLEEAFKRRR